MFLRGVRTRRTVKCSHLWPGSHKFPYEIFMPLAYALPRWWWVTVHSVKYSIPFHCTSWDLRSPTHIPTPRFSPPPPLTPTHTTESVDLRKQLGTYSSSSSSSATPLRNPSPPPQKKKKAPGATSGPREIPSINWHSHVGHPGGGARRGRQTARSPMTSTATISLSLPPCHHLPQSPSLPPSPSVSTLHSPCLHPHR